ncbi:MAG: hypothetical protein Kilf2KO_15860 [Rhodospirillales bacterium]
MNRSDKAAKSRAGESARAESRAKRDLWIALAIVALLMALSVWLDLAERWTAWAETHEVWEADEILVVLSLSALGLAWFSYRRWRDATAARRNADRLAESLAAENRVRLAAEEDFRRQVERFDAASRSAKLGYYIWDIERDRCLYCSDEYARLYGLTAEEYMTSYASLDRDLVWIHPEDRETYLEAVKDADSTLKPLSLEYRIVTKSGKVRDVRLLEHNYEVNDGRPIRSEGTLQDISDLKQAETRLVQALNASSNLFALFDDEDRLVSMNGGYRKLLGLETDRLAAGMTFTELLEHSATKVLPLRDAEARAAWVERRQRRRELPAKNLEIQIQSGDWVELNDLVMKDGSVLTIGTVITERKAVEERLRRSQRLEAVGQLTSGFAQDFNNLLSVIQGNAELLEIQIGVQEPGEEAKPGQKPLAALLEASQQGADLIQYLLAFSHQQALHLTNLDLVRLLEQTAAQLEWTLGPGIELKIDCADDLWPVRSDGAQLRNALINLASNARAALPDGGAVTVTARNGPQSSAGDEGASPAADFVSLSIEDDGLGMSPGVLARAVDPFFTTDTARQRSGLGLSMVQGFVQQTGGQLLLESQPGEGTRVELLLPRALAAEIAALSDESGDHDGAGALILIVDDNHLARNAAVALLERLGYRSLEAQSIDEAIRLLQAGPVDLLLADRNLVTDGAGAEFIATAKGSYPDLPIVYMIDQGPEAALAAAQAPPPDGDVLLLAKPLWRAELAAKVKAALAGTSA